MDAGTSTEAVGRDQGVEAVGEVDGAAHASARREAPATPTAAGTECACVSWR